MSDANDLAPSKRRSSSVSSRSNKPSKRLRLPSSSIDPTLDFSLGLSTDETDLLAQMDALTSAHAALGVGAEAGGSQAGGGGGGGGGEEDLGAREAKARSLARATLWGDTLDDAWDLNDQAVIAILGKFEVRFSSFSLTFPWPYFALLVALFASISGSRRNSDRLFIFVLVRFLNRRTGS